MPLSKAKHFQYPLQLVSTTGEPRLHYCTLGPLHRAERQSPHSNPFYCTPRSWVTENRPRRCGKSDSSVAGALRIGRN